MQGLWALPALSFSPSASPVSSPLYLSLSLLVASSSLPLCPSLPVSETSSQVSPSHILRASEHPERPGHSLQTQGPNSSTASPPHGRHLAPGRGGPGAPLPQSAAGVQALRGWEEGLHLPCGR